MIARALADAYRPRSDEYIPAWKLCISALLAPRGSESERALVSAQVLGVQQEHAEDEGQEEDAEQDQGSSGSRVLKGIGDR